jgi:hypothetical protein
MGFEKNFLKIVIAFNCEVFTLTEPHVVVVNKKKTIQLKKYFKIL